MAFHYAFNLADPAAVKSFVEGTMSANGYTKDYEVGDYTGFKIKNFINATTGAEAFFIPIFLIRAGEIGMTLAKSTTTSTADGIIPEVNMPILSSLTFPVAVFMTITPLTVTLCCRDANNIFKTVVCATVDYRYLYLTGIEPIALHLENLQNNGQCVFNLADPSTGRILYGGDTSNQTLFNQPIDLDYISLNNSSASYLPKDTLTLLRPIPCSVSLVKELSSNDKFFGVLSHAMLSSAGSFFPLDSCSDTSGNLHRVFKDSASGNAIVVRENG